MLTGPRVQVADLVSGSALALARASGRLQRIAFSGDAPALEIGRVNDVLYVPSALDRGQSLQVTATGVMPVEAVFDDFTVGFVRRCLESRGEQLPQDYADDSGVGEVCILGNVFSRNFTHWHEELMKVVVLERARVDCRYVLAALPTFARELLAVLGIHSSRVVEVAAPTRFRTALYSTPVSYRNVADYPRVLLDLRARILATDEGRESGQGPRLWLDRGLQTRLGRRLVNEDEVHAALDRHGFQRLDMGALGVREQIAAARSMEVMAGLHGSGFVHSQLMPPGSRVIECFSPLYLNPTYTEIYRVLRHRYSQITATNTPSFPYLHSGDVLVDLQQLELALAACP